MKKHHPDEDAIPTLNDLVFPGESQPRPPTQSQQERVDPQLSSEPPSEAVPDGFESDAQAREETDPNPFLLLPEEENMLAEWELSSGLQPDVQASDDSEPHSQEPSPPAPALEIEHDFDRTDDSEHPWTEHSLHLSDEADSLEPHTLADSPSPKQNDASTELFIEDLPHSSNASHELQDFLAEKPFEPEQQASPEPLSAEPDYYLVRSAVSQVLESELDRLTDIVTDAVIARLRG